MDVALCKGEKDMDEYSQESKRRALRYQMHRLRSEGIRIYVELTPEEAAEYCVRENVKYMQDYDFTRERKIVWLDRVRR